MRIGEVLVEQGVITREQLEAALARQAQQRGTASRRLGEILVQDFGVAQDVINLTMARYYGFQEFDRRVEDLEKEEIERIRELLAPLDSDVKLEFMERCLIPFRPHEQWIEVMVFLTPEPANPEVPSFLAEMGYHRFELVYCAREQILKLFELVLPQENEFLKSFQEAAESGAALVTEDVEDLDDEASIEEEIHQSLLTDLVEGMLIEAVRRGASDIHVIPKGAYRTEIHFRIDGKLQLWHVQEGVKPESVSAVIKDRARNVDRFEWESAQDGFIQRRIDGHLIRYRVSVLPIVSSEYRRKFESIVIRVLDDRKVITDLRKIGFQEQALRDFQHAISTPQGLVILTGPTGSGKSTTLVAALHQVLTPQVNVLTVEDPVEYHIRGARQLKINPRMNFEQALRAILRHDPDIVMVGEIRDRETAELAIKLANTGHLTFSTLHTNDAPSAISRLYKMGIEPFLIAYAINIVVAQRLLRRLCPACKRPVEPNRELALKLGFTERQIEEVTFYGPVGCEHCLNGYRGRMAIHEALLFTKEIRRMIIQASNDIDEDAIVQEAIKNGMLTLRASGRERVISGQTSLEEVAFTTADD
jgi:type IV pilus assembly protein PilB